MRLNYRGKSHELEALCEAKLILDVSLFRPVARPLPTFFVNERANNDIFAEADVLFLIIGKAFDVSFGLYEIIHKKMRVIVCQVVKDDRSELQLLAFVVSCSTILPREMAVVPHLSAFGRASERSLLLSNERLQIQQCVALLNSRLSSLVRSSSWQSRISYESS